MPDYRMKWIRIWPHAWFDSSMRVELTNAERAFWVDVIALAGKSRIPGVICSDPEGKIGYPLPMLSSLLVSWTPDEVTAILDKLEKTERVKVTRIPLMSGEDGWIVHITNWQKYQSEAQRVSKYKKHVYSSTPHGRKNARTEVEVDVEGEVEKEGEGEKANAHGAFKSPNGGDASYPTTSILKTLSRNELKGLQTTLKRSLREKRLPESLRRPLAARLEEVEKLL